MLFYGDDWQGIVGKLYSMCVYTNDFRSVYCMMSCCMAMLIVCVCIREQLVSTLICSLSLVTHDTTFGEYDMFIGASDTTQSAARFHATYFESISLLLLEIYND